MTVPPWRLPGVLQNVRGLQILHVPAAPHAREHLLGVQRTAARFITRLALNVCCHRERAGLPLTGMFSS